MSPRSHCLVCPFPSKAFAELRDAHVAVRANAGRGVASAIRSAASRQALDVKEIRLRSAVAISDLEFPLGEQLIAVVVEADQLGPLPKLVARLEDLRAANLTFLLSPASAENCLAAQILASLKVHAGIGMLDGQVDWEACTDLACYAYYSKARRACVEPFHFILRNYRGNLIPFGELYLVSPARFLHLSEDGRVALTPADLKGSAFIADSLASAAERLRAEPDLAVDGSHRHFLEQDGCAYCPGWRLCGGQFEHERDEAGCCREFFRQVLEGVEFNQDPSRSA